MNIRLSTGLSPGCAGFYKYPFYTDNTPFPHASHLASNSGGVLAVKVTDAPFPMTIDFYYFIVFCFSYEAILAL